METIFALGTGPGRAAIAVIRLSGPTVQQVLIDFTGAVSEPRAVRLTALRDPENGEELDQGLTFFFPGPHSATGEDYAELQLHGGRAVIDAVLSALSRRRGLRMAEPGEFARRGFVNGKLDLSQAEALADLIDAQTEAQRRQALRIAGGALRREVERWRAAMIDALALVEAELDFSDESDVGSFDLARLRLLLEQPLEEMRAALKDAPASERMREGFLVMILGAPNAGKSTLLNALAQRDLAIVSPTPGTTRDMIEAHLDIEGLPVTFVDTAGLRDAADEIERIGVDRVLERVVTADLVLWLSPDAQEPNPGLASEVDVLRVATKTDLAPAPPVWLGVSAKTGAGVDALLKEIGQFAKDRLGDGSSALVIRERHRSAVASAMACLESALVSEKDLEFLAEDLRSAGRALGRIVGSVDVEDVLDAVFARFCIGK
ncbi:tRNA uridine-5-carboxymethylaminomethyl(34) synthesis GTPase MnmE [Methylocystis sp. MJC1]|jgi:tRNA modification GTPase|uniref:tRNA uridine-5-carboxymethylaminomethyl(34) synthesis GTPase MnmE n=1 Tax=Methylocystis sp. MJC1 TaxID=2654282 RepID=UPI0013E9D0F6|nr:tRNA uridine-5-carboxymethylaminomethyl(34) synthesis GTPase MnmE [Methylocystis sp. MJC1]KAF2991886.1 tRNA modification GTPase MnmE [Methylocystis sp. MJC1]MBU6528989.1 tRNA uridine-5-carboxymethylaminomethyl(34) synthesis GTPase MnmE [Methylocystis sp. MJC1]UZX11869.1 tRNA uridine-5-carboxymethylaminomethyl(34) synthesis GTPase MnmE [Methylocystis sp. MJC1]